MSQFPPPAFNGFTDPASGFTDPATSPAPFTFNSKVMAGAIIVLFLVIFFIVLLHVYARWFLRRSSGSYVIRRGFTFGAAPSGAASARNNTGLDKATITQLPTFSYTAISPVHKLEAENSDESSTECAVCLSEFQENEKVRMLPSCRHIFHTDCIDMWLFSHSTCPLCRTKVMPAVATSASTDQQHQGQEAMEPSPGTTEGNPVGSHGVEYPCNVLFWGNQTQMVSSQEPSSSSLPMPPSSRMPGSRFLSQISIDIPPIEGNLLESASGPLSAKCTMDQEASSSQPIKSPGIKSPGLRASIKRILSRQSSRHKSSIQEGYEESPK